MNIELENAFALLIVFQCLVSIGLLIGPRSRRIKSNYLLSSLFLVFFVQFLFTLLRDIGFVSVKDIWLDPLRFSYGPIIYLYVRSLVRSDFEFNRKLLWYFIPVIAGPALIALYPDGSSKFPVYMVQFVIIAYLFASLRLWDIYRKVSSRVHSDFNAVTSLWVKQLLLVFLFILSLDVVFNLLGVTDQPLIRILFPIQLIFILVLVTIVVFKSISSPELFHGIAQEDEKYVLEEGAKYQTSSLTLSDIEKFKKEIENYFIADRLYLEANLTLQDLSSKIGLSMRDMSYVINEGFKMTFPELMNSYRIELAKKLLSEDETLNISQILYKVGFNTKSSFYNAFKKKVGVSPSTYRAQMKKGDHA